MLVLRKRSSWGIVAATTGTTTAILLWALERRRRQHQERLQRERFDQYRATRVSRITSPSSLPWGNREWLENPIMEGFILPLIVRPPSPCYCDTASSVSSATESALPWTSPMTAPPSSSLSSEDMKSHNLGLGFTKRMTNSVSPERLNLLYRVHWDRPLGEGGFGAVYSATDQATGERVACKQMSKEYTDDVAFQREIEAFLHLREHGGHPNICTLHQTFDEGSDYYLILDFISGGEMFDHLITNGAYSEADAARLMREVASALAFLHGTGCVHGDLKPENLMLSTKHASDAVVKLIDFGCAQLIGREDIPATDVNTEAYCPPEVLRRDTERYMRGKTGKGRNNCSTRDRMEPSMDMWALGIILYIMLTGFHPFDFEGNSSDQVIARRIMNSTPFPVGEDSKYTAHLSESAIDLILKLLAWDPDDRITAAEMLDHPWVRGETARTDKIADSDTKLSKFRAFKSGLEAKVFSDLYNWSEETAANATKKTSLIERSFKSFDAQEKGFITRKDLSRQLKSNVDADDSDDDGLTLSNFEDLLSDSMKNKYFRKGEVVYREGEEGNEMFFINSGVVEISTHDGFKLQLKQGDFVGEGALLSQNRTRCATVTCSTPVHVIEITREYFEKYLMASFQDVNLKIREKDKSRALARTKAILRQQKELKPLEVSKGDTLYIVGDDGNELFILEKGKVDIRAHDGTTVFTVNRGDLFGERAVVANRPRTTTAVCSSEKCKVHVMDESAFTHVLEESPGLQESLNNVSLRREFQQAVVFHTKKPFPTSTEALKEVFDLVDADHNGKISLDEVRVMLKDMDQSIPEEEIQSVLKSLDIDQTGVVNFEEFKLIFGFDSKPTITKESAEM